MADLTLYVTDLDGTLLARDARISDLTVRTLERLIDGGVLITCATARSWVTVQRVLGSLRFRMPMILCNGTFTFDAVNSALLDQQAFPEATARLIVDTCRENGLAPIV